VQIHADALVSKNRHCAQPWRVQLCMNVHAEYFASQRIADLRVASHLKKAKRIMFWIPRLSRAQHLALYSVFHRSAANRLVHGMSLPVVMLTGAVLVCHLHWFLALAIVFGLCALLALIDFAGALLVAAWLVPLCGVGALIAQEFSASWQIALVVVLQLVAWWLAVRVGHVRIEPSVLTPGGAEDSNLYFRRRYFVAANLGVPISRADVFVQFAIALLASTRDVLVWCGFDGKFAREVDFLREGILIRLRQGLSPFE
jgi:hypothetical protein